jgi:hypothetical protein
VKSQQLAGVQAAARLHSSCSDAAVATAGAEAEAGLVAVAVMTAGQPAASAAAVQLPQQQQQLPGCKLAAGIVSTAVVVTAWQCSMPQATTGWQE